MFPFQTYPRKPPSNSYQRDINDYELHIHTLTAAKPVLNPHTLQYELHSQLALCRLRHWNRDPRMAFMSSSILARCLGPGVRKQISQKARACAREMPAGVTSMVYDYEKVVSQVRTLAPDMNGLLIQ